MLEYSIYAILSPEGFASILWKDGSRAKEAAGLMKITAHELKDLGVIERVIQETKDETMLTKEEIAANLRQLITAKLTQLSELSTDELVNTRYQRFRKF